MKSLHIEWVADRRWRWVWAGAFFFASTILVVPLWYWNEQRQSWGVQTQKILRLQTELLSKQPTPPVALPSADPRRTSAIQAARLLDFDVNSVFDSAERINFPGSTRLRGITFDFAASSLKMEYELDSIASAARVTEVLNAANPKRPWHLDVITAVAGMQGGMGYSSVIPPSFAAQNGVVVPAPNPFGAPTALPFQGTWTAKLEGL